MKFVSLHSHSTFSFMDGFGTPKEHVERVAELSMEALALTEHGNVSSHVQLEKHALKAGIKPIFGCELYTAPSDMRETKNMRKWHLTAVAADQIGYHNLMRLVSRSWEEGFYRWPTVLGNMLVDHHEGIIFTSGCADSKIACDLLGGKGRERGDIADARKSIARFRDLLGDRFYLEVQAFPELERSKAINCAYEELAKEFGVPLVATADVHYPYPEDNEMQKILHAAGRNTGTVAAAEASWEYDIRLTYPTSDRAIYQRLRATGLSKSAAEQAILNSAEIAGRCNVTLEKAERLHYPVSNSVETFKEWIKEGWRYRDIRSRAGSRERLGEYRKRLLYEMEVIEEKGFIDYFLLLSDLVKYAKDSGIPVGPARGSAAASLVSYLLRITEIDPMDYPLMLFERFIDPSRADLPDIDLDFADDRRDEVRQYLIRKYGADRVGNIGNFVRYRGKNAINDVARVHEIPVWEANIINSLVVERSGGDSRFDASLEDTKDMFPAARAVFEKYPELDLAIKLEGNVKGMSVHAAGLVVANTPITDVCATYSRESGADKKMTKVLSIDKYDAEYLDIMKIDALGLSTMGMIAIALDLIGMKLEDLYSIPMDDPKTMQAFHDNDVIGIFQFEGRATRIVCADVKPDTFLEVVDVNALSRPGPLFSGMTAEYVKVKHGRNEAEKLHPIVDAVTHETKGQVVYQEQVLKIIKEIGGFPVTKVGEIRRIISKKMGEAQFNTMLDDFVNGARERHNIGREQAVRIWKFLVTSATYSFNTAHSVSYTTLAWWCMWLKQHHPMEFYCAALIKAKVGGVLSATGTIAGGSGSNILSALPLIKDAKKHGIVLVPPDLKRSGVTWSIDRERNEIVSGFSQVKGLGDKMSQVIIDDRNENGHFENWDSLLRVKGIGPKKIITIKEFADNDDPFGIEKTRKTIGSVIEAIRRKDIPVPMPTHNSDQLYAVDNVPRAIFIGMIKLKEYKDAIEDQRSRTGDSPEEIRKRLKSPDMNKSCTLHAYDAGDEDVYLRVDRFRYSKDPKIQKQLEAIVPGRDVIVALGRKKKVFGISFSVEQLWVIDPEME